MTPSVFRRIALALAGAVEGAHMGHPDFRVSGRIFATLSPDNRRGMVKVTPAQQEELLEHHGAMFEPASGAWGRQGCTMVILAAAEDEAVGEAMTLAWQQATTAKARPTKKRAKVRKIPARKTR